MPLVVPVARPAVAVVLVLLLPTAVGHVLPNSVIAEVDGTLAPSAPLVYAGGLHVPAGVPYELLWRPLEPQRLTSAAGADRLFVVVERTHWTSADPEGKDATGPLVTTSEEHVLLNPSLGFRPVGPQALILFRGDADDAVPSFEAVRCEAAVARAHMPTLEGATFADWSVRSTCEARRGNLTGRSVEAVGHEVEVAFAGQGDEDGRPTLERVVAGLASGPHPLLPALFEHVRTVVRWRLEGTDVLFGWSAAGRMELSSQRVDLVGLLQIPDARGALAWGPETIRDPAATGIRGYFTLSPPAGHMRIMGHSHSDAPASTRTVADGGDGAVAAVATAGAAAAALAVWLGRGALGALFSRLAQDRLLDQERRRLVSECIRANPGINVMGVAQRLGLARGAVRHHVTVLLRNRLVEQRRFGRQNALYPRGHALPASHAQLALLGHALRRGILDQIRRDPEVSQAHLAARLGVTQSYVSRLVDDLEAQGLLRSVRVGRRRTYEVAIAFEPEAPSALGESGFATT